MHETADRRDRCLILRGNGFIRCGIKDVLSAFHIPLEAWNALKTFYTKTDEAIASPNRESQQLLLVTAAEARLDQQCNFL
ncbi:hypothetical protein E4U46_002793 [Claviceps purpurea]|nr:hypothetical protein E4U46_002793 [Claviceps purpurea]